MGTAGISSDSRWSRLLPDGRPSGEHAWLAWAVAAGVPLLFLTVHIFIGLRTEHFLLGGVALVFSWWGPRLRGLIRAAGPFMLTGIGYDFLRLAISLRNPIHVADLWRAEQALFGFQTASGHVVITDWVATHTHTILDAVCGSVYVLYLVVPIAIASLLYAKVSTGSALLMSCTFALMSVIGWFIWLAWPAAPPWYVDQHGLGPVVLDAAPSAAGGARFDDLFGVNLFRRFYERSWNVFGAMPSLHVAYGLLPLIGVWRLGNKARLPAALWALAMIYSAVYLRHHYILDAIAGIAVALLGLGSWAVLQRLAERVASHESSSPSEAFQGGVPGDPSGVSQK